MITTGAGLLIRENSWAHRLFPPCICIFLANTYCGSEIAASAVRTTATSPRPQYTKISGEEQAYISRPDEKRPESDRLIYDLGTGLPALTIANCFSQGWRFPSRLFFASSFPSRPDQRDHPLRILGIFLAPLGREFDVANRQRPIMEGIFIRGALNAFFAKRWIVHRILQISRTSCLWTIQRLRDSTKEDGYFMWNYNFNMLWWIKIREIKLEFMEFVHNSIILVHGLQ